ncbi:MAG: hypothetical protein K2M36_04500, partial [Clostridia bacterium]|nr:hypothetical protein [Clostridia bacterium]
SERVEVTLDLPESELDLSIERRLLAQQYVDRARDVVDFHFGAEVESLIIEDGKVRGINIGGEKIFADLVVDNSGALSKFRALLPKSAGITATPDKDEIFVAYRAFHKRSEGVSEPKNTNKAYLKHLGKAGISWSILDPAGTVNVLIGRTERLPEEEFKLAYAALKKSNPIIDDEVVRGGKTCIIPIRRPLSRMATDGYVAIGDSAFMTIPMIGSGIENSMKAACMLADAIIATDSCDVQTLWLYQRRYYLARGAEHMGVDVLKRWLLGCNPNDLDWLFEKGVISAKDMGAGATGKLLKLTVGDLLSKAAKGISKLPLLLSMSAMLSKCNKAARIGRAIPKTYDEKKIEKWENKISKLFK